MSSELLVLILLGVAAIGSGIACTCQQIVIRRMRGAVAKEREAMRAAMKAEAGRMFGSAEDWKASHDTMRDACRELTFACNRYATECGRLTAENERLQHLMGRQK